MIQFLNSLKQWSYRRSTLVVITSLVALQAFAQDNVEPAPLAEGEGSLLVRAHCGACHSLKLVTSNRASREGWLHMIRWMQEKQNLWPLDARTEDTILTYLATHYAPTAQPRRAPLPTHLLPTAVTPKG